MWVGYRSAVVNQREREESVRCEVDDAVREGAQDNQLTSKCIMS